jgi:hypothetical protein
MSSGVFLPFRLSQIKFETCKTITLRFYSVLMEAHLASCTMGSGTFWGVNCLEHGAHHPPPSSARLQMCQSYTSVSPLYLHRHIMRLPDLVNNYVM